MRRLFIAIELPQNILDSIDGAISELKSRIKGKFVDRKKLHITVLFLGNPAIPDAKIIDAVASTGLNRKIEISGIGEFGGAGRNHAVIFLKVNTDLSDIYNELSSKLGLKNTGEYVPHITLCRTKGAFDVNSVKDSFHVNESFIAKKLSLLNSNLREYKRVY